MGERLSCFPKRRTCGRLDAPRTGEPQGGAGHLSDGHLGPECRSTPTRAGGRGVATGTWPTTQLVEDRDTDAQHYLYVRTGVNHYSLAFTYECLAWQEMARQPPRLVFFGDK